jgi:hypothetical protein
MNEGAIERLAAAIEQSNTQQASIATPTIEPPDQTPDRTPPEPPTPDVEPPSGDANPTPEHDPTAEQPESEVGRAMREAERDPQTQENDRGIEME